MRNSRTLTMNLLSLGISLVVLGGIPSPEPLDSASHTKTFSIYFPFDSSVYDSDYLGNAESAASLAAFSTLSDRSASTPSWRPPTPLRRASMSTTARSPAAVPHDSKSLFRVSFRKWRANTN